MNFPALIQTKIRIDKKDNNVKQIIVKIILKYVIIFFLKIKKDMSLVK